MRYKFGEAFCFRQSSNAISTLLVISILLDLGTQIKLVNCPVPHIESNFVCQMQNEPNASTNGNLIMDSKLQITRISEIVLSVKSIPEMRKFYTEVLGFPLHSQSCHEDADGVNPDGEPTICFLTIGEVDTPLGRNGHPQLLALIDYRRHIHARKRFLGHDVSRSTLNHLAFEIQPSSFDAHWKRFAALGIETTYSEFPNMNARAMFFRDPEGNTLEFISHIGVEFDGTSPASA